MSEGVIGFTVLKYPHSISPASGEFGAKVPAWDESSVLLQQLGNGWLPGLDPAGLLTDNYILISSNNISLNYADYIPSITDLGAIGGVPTFPSICFLRGTMIATPHGEVPIERLSVGELVRTPDGRDEPIVWVGHSRVIAPVGRRGDTTPVIVRRGALGPNVPYTDLRVTKAHSLFIDDVLIPVEYLVNHRSILWDDHARGVEIFHIALSGHDVILANGAPAETFRDDGNRWLFAGADNDVPLPQGAPVAPVVTGGPVVDAVWWRLLDRAEPRRSVPLTEDADLHLLADGRRIAAASRNGNVYRFRLDQIPADLRLASRSASPQELGLARDPRELGVAISRIIVWSDRAPYTVKANDARLCDGFYAYESATQIRWTNGNAALPSDLLDGLQAGATIEVFVSATTQYIEMDIQQDAA